ncbi:MAG TPA: hypothetical protein VM580_15600 [Labilithrix sp.]|nr:hypothetical protein [Labilithrix sp.]
MLRQRLSALAAALSLLGAIAAACDDDVIGAGVHPDAGEPEGSLGDSICPAEAPTEGERCSLPEGTTCAFGACGSPIATCFLGAWRYSKNPQSRPLCPRSFPASESACPPCWPAGVECTYGSSDCSAPDASANTTVASCVDAGMNHPQRWVLRSFPCAKLDAGADVQRDSEADAD